MNCSDIISCVYEYLSFRKIERSAEIDKIIEQSFNELEALNCFKHIHAEMSEPLEFMKSEPYASFLAGSTGYFLVATTLGAEVDRVIKRYSITDMKKMLVFDATANAYLEAKADEYEKSLGNNISYRFCCGYQGSKASDIQYIFDILKPEKIGITRLDDGMMAPQKSMCGIIAIGKNEKKKCGACVMLGECAFIKAGKKCYSVEKY